MPKGSSPGKSSCLTCEHRSGDVCHRYPIPYCLIYCGIDKHWCSEYTKA